jgi:hypothetical protein
MPPHHRLKGQVAQSGDKADGGEQDTTAQEFAGRARIGLHQGSLGGSRGNGYGEIDKGEWGDEKLQGPTSKHQRNFNVQASMARNSRD